MEAYVLTLLGVTGYMLSLNNKNNKQDNIKNTISKNEKPSMNNLYSSNYVTETLQDDMKKNNKLYKKSLDSENTNVIPINKKQVETDRTVYSRLADIPMDNNEFKHNNMVPFFGGKLTQNVDSNRTQEKLDTFTGTGNFWKPKQEVENFANITKDNIYGNQNDSDFLQSREVKSKYVTNYLPFEQETVGPGLNQGYTSKPSGGLQQINKREFELPKTVDELRVKCNPKETYEGRTVDGMKGNLPADIGEVCKNRVDTFYEQTEDMYLKAGNSANDKATQRPCVDMKVTNRATTGLKTEEGNVTSMVKSLTAPLLDIMKVNKKEYTVMHGRPQGNLQSTAPPKLTIYDPNDVARTTIKETTIHDTTINNLTGNKRIITYDPDDVAKTTMKETTEDNDRDGNVGNVQGADAYRTTNTEAKETDRQFTSDNQYYGIGESDVKKEMSYDDMYNATIDEVKDILFKNRKPTKTSVKIYNEIDNMNVNHKNMACNDISERETYNYGRISNTIPTKETEGQLTHDKFTYNNDNRINPDILSPLKNNPYAKPLNVF